MESRDYMDRSEDKDHLTPGLDDSEDGFADASAVAVESRQMRIASGQHGERVDKALVHLAPEFSRTWLQSLVERGHVRLDGAAVAASSRRVRAAQLLSIELIPTQESLAFRPESMDLDVLFEDPHLLVLNKPAGLVVHPAPGNWSGTLLNGLLAHNASAANLPRAGIVHRLDKDTSGVMMVGKSLVAVTALVRAMAARQVNRQYLALAHGEVPQAEQHIDQPIGRDPHVRVRMAVVASGKPARTDMRCVAMQEGVSAVVCKLHSGRTHQIRVHLASVGHALVADTVYGGKPKLDMTRQALHAARLALKHPVNGLPLQFEAQQPDDFKRAWGQVCGSDAQIDWF